MIRNMGNVNLKFDFFSFFSVFFMFLELVDFNGGKEIYGFVIRNGFDVGLYVGIGLIDMYVKCNRIEDVYKMFFLLFYYDSIFWNFIIVGCV